MDVPTSAEAAGASIRMMRLARYWTQKDVAVKVRARFGIRWHPETVCVIEQAKRELKVSELVALMLLFDVPAESIVLPDNVRGIRVGHRPVPREAIEAVR